VELLDLAGPVQVFTEAKFIGYDIGIDFYSYTSAVTSTAGLEFGKIKHFKEAGLQPGDFVVIPGMKFDYIESEEFRAEKEFFQWLSDCADRLVNVCSVCDAAFVLGEAGLLDGRECTTHWRRMEALQARFPRARVISDLVDHIAGENAIETLASMVAMSPRNLTRVFKEATGTTIVEYLTRLRRENAKTLLHNPDYTVDYIAAQCGFKSARQLQRILK
jgi:transcriptional regulator GlxA family with amidase domain